MSKNESNHIIGQLNQGNKLIFFY